MNTVKAACFFVLFLFATSHLPAQQLRAFEQDKKWGYQDASGKIVIPAQFGTADYFGDGLAKVGNKEATGWKYGMIDATGKLVIPIIYESLGRPYSAGRILASLQGKWGFLDKTGKTAVPFIYERAGNYAEDMAEVKLNGKWGFIDLNGVMKIPIIYDAVTSFSKKLSRVTLNAKSGFIDNTGKLVTEIKYDEIHWGHIAAQLYGVRMNGKFAILNRQGIELTPFVYEAVYPNFDDKNPFIAVKSGYKWGVVNDKGVLIIPMKYDELAFVNDKLIQARYNGKWGIINVSDKVLLPLQYAEKPEIR
ncbi:MAG TPA: WG repeat-containing protein, partial [Sediminibacterium sp.]